MDYEVKLLKGNDYFDYIRSHEQVDLDEKYINQIKEYISQFGYDSSYIKVRKEHVDRDKSKSKVILDMTYDTRLHSGNPNPPKSSKLKPVSFELFEFNDEWFLLKFWHSYATSGERIDNYLCDQFDSVIYQLDQCFKTFPKKNDDDWNKNIKTEFNRQRSEVLKSALEMTRRHIMSFTSFQELDLYRKTYLQNESFKNI